jgi:hypothetical protein
MTTKDHERAVAGFMRQMASAAPERTGDVIGRYPVLSERQMRTRRETEIPSGLDPSPPQRVLRTYIDP